MKPLLTKVNQELAIAFGASACALILLAQSWITFLSRDPAVLSLWNVAMMLALATGVVAAHKFPIHLQPHTKVHLNTVPLFLMVVLLPRPFALLGMGGAMLAGQLWIRKQRGALPRDIATTVARWIIVGFAASVIAWLPWPEGMGREWSLFAAAVVLFLGDIVTVSFQISPWMNESPWHLMILSFQEGWLAEGVQYLLGVLGAIAALSHAWALGLLAVPTIVVYIMLKHSREIRDSTRQMLEAMADAVDLRDPYTGGHSKRVAEFLHGTLKELGIVGIEADLIRTAARLHDIGKLGMPDSILNKPGPLTAPEWKVMQSHPDMGADLLGRYPDFARGIEFVRYHHEHWDGSGYPRGLKGAEIPLGARIIAVADAFDSMTSNRPYRAALSVSQAVSILKQERAKTWDPQVVDAFVGVIEKRIKLPGAEPMGVSSYATASASE